MIEILKFIFMDFWHFVGTIILIECIAKLIPGLHFRSGYTEKNEKKDSNEK